MMEGVGPGVKTEETRSVRKAAIVDAEKRSSGLVEEVFVGRTVSRRVSSTTCLEFKSFGRVNSLLFWIGDSD